ncbi:MAG TPA: hypothetical protein VJ863_03500 [Sphaerochaeta sp.]|nr:hypothetical protein [Sphaerochaeta sp.]
MDKKKNLIHMHKSPIARDFQLPMLKKSAVLMGGATISDFAPKLTCILLEKRDALAEYAIIHIALAPFSQKVEEVGILTMGPVRGLIEQLHPLYELAWGSCPSFLLSSVLFSESFPVLLYSNLFRVLGNGYTLLEGIRNTPDDPQKRTRAAMDSLAQERRMLSEGESVQLAKLLLEPDTNKREMQAFLAVWEGAISLQKDTAVKAMGQKEIHKALGYLGSSCRFGK